MQNSSEYHIVGAGITGLTCAILLTRAGKKVVVHEAADRLGGLCASINCNGVDVHLYGPHIFHTSNRDIWNFMNSVHPLKVFRATACLKSTSGFVNIPLTPSTIATLTNTSYSEGVSCCKLAIQSPPYDGESLANWSYRVLPGKVARECITLYSEKAWGISAELLPAALFKRLPIYTEECRNYHTSTFSGLPGQGWDNWLQQASAGIEVHLNEHVNPFMLPGPVIYTGPLDQLANSDCIKYHVSSFALKKSISWKAPSHILHDPGSDSLAYRIANYNRFTELHGREEQWLGLELCAASSSGVLRKAYPDPCAPHKTAAAVQDLIAYLLRNNIYCVGRLAEYKYLRLADCVSHAMSTVQNILKK